MTVSSTNFDYGTVQCGHCKIITVRLYNTQLVKLVIKILPPTGYSHVHTCMPFHFYFRLDASGKLSLKNLQKRYIYNIHVQVQCVFYIVYSLFQYIQIPKHTPLHIRKKIKEKPPPNYFEVDPPHGILLPEQNMDIQIKFMPSDEVIRLIGHQFVNTSTCINVHLVPSLQMIYNDQIPFVVNQNPDVNIVIHVTGKGSEPQIVFDRTLIEFDPVLPFSEGSEAEITITNPMDYPLEIYSLEFDNQYLDEEDVSMLRKTVSRY